jgi:hypothetical protein
MIVRSGAPLSLVRRCSSTFHSSNLQLRRPRMRGFRTKDDEETFVNEDIDAETQAEYDYWTKKRPIFPLSRQGLTFREDDDASNSSYLKVDMEERFAKTVHELTIAIKEELEATFPVKRDEMTDEEYTNPSTKRMPLYIQPRPLESFSITLFHGSSKVKSLPKEDIDRWYRLLVLRLEESGFVHENGSLTEENIAHPEDFYFKFDSVVTYPPKTHHLLVLQLRASLGFYRLYEDVQIVSNRIPALKPLVHRSAKIRRPIWLPQIVLADIRNHMDGCKREEKRLRNMLSQRELQPFAFFPDWIRLAGPRPLDDLKKYNWDFTFEHLRNAKRPTVPPPFYPDDLRY